MIRRRHHADKDELEDNDILRDGERLRVPMRMMDSMQKEIAHDHPQPLVVDALGETGLALHRPGARYLLAPTHTTDAAVQATLRVMRDEAYQQHNVEQSRRWANSDREIVVKLITGDARTDAYLAREEHDSNAWRGAYR